MRTKTIADWLFFFFSVAGAFVGTWAAEGEEGHNSQRSCLLTCPSAQKASGLCLRTSHICLLNEDNKT